VGTKRRRKNGSRENWGNSEHDIPKIQILAGTKGTEDPGQTGKTEESSQTDPTKENRDDGSINKLRLMKEPKEGGERVSKNLPCPNKTR